MEFFLAKFVDEVIAGMFENTSYNEKYLFYSK